MQRPAFDGTALSWFFEDYLWPRIADGHVGDYRPESYHTTMECLPLQFQRTSDVRNRSLALPRSEVEHMTTIFEKKNFEKTWRGDDKSLDIAKMTQRIRKAMKFYKKVQEITREKSDQCNFRNFLKTLRPKGKICLLRDCSNEEAVLWVRKETLASPAVPSSSFSEPPQVLVALKVTKFASLMQIWDFVKK